MSSRKSVPTIATVTFAVALLALLPACSAPIADASQSEGSESGTLPSTEEIEAVYTAWSDAVATGDARTVNARYAEDAVLLPTVAPGVLDTGEERIGYFESFLKSRPSGVVTESVARPLGENSATFSGLYTFTLQSTGDVVPARFTYVFARDTEAAEWKIIEHHSSREPEVS